MVNDAVEKLIPRLVQAVRRIATERPSVYVHPVKNCTNKVGDKMNGCFYDERMKCSDGTTGCIIGQAMKAIDWPYPKDFNFAGGIGKLLGGYGIHGSRVDVSWLSAIQGNQDNGYTWGQALKSADDIYTVDGVEAALEATNA